MSVLTAYYSLLVWAAPPVAAMDMRKRGGTSAPEESVVGPIFVALWGAVLVGGPKHIALAFPCGHEDRPVERSDVASGPGRRGGR